ncbi:SgcJ/EcaC family oxidoreductase [soil metagenome]
MNTINPVSPQQIEDEASIRQLVKQMEECWNAGDGHAYATRFTEDADFVTIIGLHISGRKAIAEGHQQIFATVYKDSQNTATITDVRFVRTDVALAHVRWHLRFWQEKTLTEAQAINTLMLVKSTAPSEYPWQITAFQNTPLVVR